MLLTVTNIGSVPLYWHYDGGICFDLNLVLRDSSGKVVAPASKPNCPNTWHHAPNWAFRQRETRVVLDPRITSASPLGPGYVPLSSWGFTQKLLPGSYSVTVFNYDVGFSFFGVGDIFSKTLVDTNPVSSSTSFTVVGN